MTAAKCLTCGAVATWENAPLRSYGEYCDGCVPRGCSCNNAYDEETGDWGGPEETDADGRLKPCIEYDYWPEGFEHDEEAEAHYAAAIIGALAQRIEARSDETPKAVQPEGREPGSEGMRPERGGIETEQE